MGESHDDIVDVRTWLGRFAECVRSRDYASAADMFDPGVVGFGTLTIRADGREQLVAHQWEKVWNDTSGFRFELDSARIGVHDGLAWAAVQWSSVGHADETTFPRGGRATFVLRTDADRWLAIHSHLSLDPRGTIDNS